MFARLADRMTLRISQESSVFGRIVALLHTYFAFVHMPVTDNFKNVKY
jgi:hypothetical protein